MTPKEKAKELVDEYYQLLGEYIFNGHFDIAKECALVAVDELIKETSFEVPNIRERYWQEVKQEIKLL
jgi:hypothetical protein